MIRAENRHDKWFGLFEIVISDSMANDDSSNSRFLKKLIGRQNYDTWKIYAKSYLVIKGLWNCTQNELAVEASEKDKETDLKAWSEINLLVHESVLSYIIETSTAHEAWESLQSAFEDSGLCRKVELLKQLVQLSLDQCDSVEDYINKVTMTSAKVKKTGLNLDDELVASLMLAGLPNEYKSLVMAVENSTAKLTLDAVKTLLLQDPKLADKKSSNGAFMVNTKKVGASGTFKYRCHKCGIQGHMAKNCVKNESGSEGQRNPNGWMHHASEWKPSANFGTFGTGL